MRKSVVAIMVLLVASLGAALVFAMRSSSEAASLRTRITALEHERDGLQAKLLPFETKERAVLRINQEFVVPQGTAQSYKFSPTVVPGTVSGTWRSSGQGWGGADDTIAGFRLTDPKDALLESEPRGSSGRFLVKVSAPGTYTFFFDNSGLFRSTPRRVFLEAEFRPN